VKNSPVSIHTARRGLRVTALQRPGGKRRCGEPPKVLDPCEAELPEDWKPVEAWNDRLSLLGKFTGDQHGQDVIRLGCANAATHGEI
jgi:hypothetical protein